MISRHPDSDLLVEYAAGSLPLAPSISITTHLQFCHDCSTTTKSLNHIGGELLLRAEPVHVADDLLHKVLSSIDEPPTEGVSEGEFEHKAIDGVGEVLPAYVRQLLPSGNLRWRYLSPSLRVATISVGEDSYELALHRIQPGGKAPEHGHTGQEITVVLTGSFSDEDGIYQPGDFIVREQGDVHKPLASQNEECICLSVLAAPIKLTGIKSLLNPFLSFSPR